MQTQLQWALSSKQLVDFNYSDYLITEDGTKYNLFTLRKKGESAISDSIGKGNIYTFTGDTSLNNGKLTKILTVIKYQDFPNMLLTRTSYINNTGETLFIKTLKNNNYEIIGGGDSPGFWSFQGESTSRRRDWILPVDRQFYQRNYMGMNNSDYGGGIPVTCLWRSDQGIAIGHVSMRPELVSLPVEKNSDAENATISMEIVYDDIKTLMSGDTISSLLSFVQLYEGDCFKPLRQYSEFMQKSGIVMPESEPAAFESMWCSWGYERTATFEEILGTLPKVKELGIKWATVDDGYQIAEGDWNLDPKRFPGGDQEMINLVKDMKKDGLKVQLWWAPLAADPGTELLEDNPEILMLSKEGKPYRISWWNSYYISPVAKGTIDQTKELVHRFISEYDFDGLKLDGQHLNAVHPDYSEANHPHDPELSVRELPDFFKQIYEESLKIKPHSVIQNCPCGTCMSFYNMPYCNQVVASDPRNSSQVRTKGYVYKALIPKTAYFGDHVELSDNGNDFASSFGTGAILGTKFTYPKNNPNVRRDYLLTPEKEEVWKKWFSLYDEKMLSTGTYLGGLYDIGFSKPETHVIEKDGRMYYAFYADEWNGEIELKGLEKNREYTVVEYTTDEKISYTTKGEKPVIKPTFKTNYLIEVY
ncbi:MAG: alpha-galactosidase [Tannerellaceae bacterium]|nr:alpha-galactosidase [Tannerellaceae bacterium]